MRSNVTRWFGLAVSIVTAGIGLTSPAVADAAEGSVGVSAGTLTFQATPGAANAVTIRKLLLSPATSGAFFAVGPVASVYELATGCFEEAGSVRCGDYRQPGGATPSGGVRGFRAILGDGDDSFLLTAQAPLTSAGAPARVSGGTGNDRITTADGADVIVGGPGINTVRGGGGNDRLEMRNGARDALIDCGAGIDTAVVDLKDPRPIACETVLRPRR